MPPPSINRTLDSIFNQQTSCAIGLFSLMMGANNSIEIIKTRKEATSHYYDKKTKDLLLPVTMGLRPFKSLLRLFGCRRLLGTRFYRKKLFHFGQTITMIVWQ